MKKSSWPILKKGDRVEVIAPGMSPRPGTLEAIPDFLKSWGLECEISPSLLGRDLICANNKRARLKSLIEALRSPRTQMVWCVRGGYGAFQLLPELAKIKPTSHKLFMGLSDGTSLHNFFVQNWGWSTIHGCNIDRFARGEAKPAELRRFKKLLFGEVQELKHSLKPLNDPAKKRGTVRGSIVGGNLITLQASFGTPFQIQTKNQILFFEDIGERAYKVHRVFEHMNQLGLFKGVRAVIFGQFTGGHEPHGPSLVPKLLKEFAGQQKFPVFSGFPSGHGENQHPLPLGTKAEIHLGLKPRLLVPTGARL